ncbi:hypothetical protein HYY74_02115 [Candidatus Woesearchaeota archaeon]|nr:hypothetical protein [Candidatus Woesearchaeota archaeon]
MAEGLGSLAGIPAVGDSDGILVPGDNLADLLAAGHIGHQFSPAEIAEFCDVTGDPNQIHRGSNPIIPGMLNLCYAAYPAGGWVLEGGYNALAAYFTEVTSPCDRIVAAHRLAPDAQSLELLACFLRDGKLLDALGKTVQSGFYFKDAQVPGGLSLAQHIVFDGDRFERFADLISPMAEKGREGIRGFLFSVAMASSALYRAIDNPETPEQEEVACRISTAGRSPVYLGLDFAMPGGIWNPVPGKFDYSVVPSLRGWNADFSLVMAQQGRVLYQASLAVKLVTPPMIERMVAQARP